MLKKEFRKSIRKAISLLPDTRDLLIYYRFKCKCPLNVFLCANALVKMVFTIRLASSVRTADDKAVDRLHVARMLQKQLLRRAGLRTPIFKYEPGEDHMCAITRMRAHIHPPPPPESSFRGRRRGALICTDREATGCEFKSVVVFQFGTYHPPIVPVGGEPTTR